MEDILPRQAETLSMAEERFQPQDLHFLIFHGRTGASHRGFGNSTKGRQNFNTTYNQMKKENCRLMSKRSSKTVEIVYH